MANETHEAYALSQSHSIEDVDALGNLTTEMEPKLSDFEDVIHENSEEENLSGGEIKSSRTQ